MYVCFESIQGILKCCSQYPVLPSTKSNQLVTNNGFLNRLKI